MVGWLHVFIGTRWKLHGLTLVSECLDWSVAGFPSKFHLKIDGNFILKCLQ